jgi:predicted ester cyclase
MDAKDLVGQAYDHWNNRDRTAFIPLYSGGVEITAPGGVVLRGKEGVEMNWESWQGAFPDRQFTIRNIVAVDDRACVEATFEGTHTGVFHAQYGGQIAPTGRHISFRFAEFYTIRDDKVITLHLYFDQMELLTQLGPTALPATS